jgi:CheY-like chemotaxis protein
MNPTGVGLGLNIAYNLALLLGPKDHHGISVKSVSGQGSTFTFILENKQDVIDPEGLLKNQDNSCEVADESPRFTKSLFYAKLQTDKSGSSYSTIPLIEKQSSQYSSCLCSKILIVDDNPFNTMAFETILDSMNIKCDSVYSGSCCIKSLRNRQGKVCGDNCKQYSVIFMDQEMPEMTGRDTVYEIKKLQEESLLSQGIRIVGCTAHKSKEEIDRFMEAGLDQCIHKPISAGMIRDTLKGTNVIEK